MKIQEGGNEHSIGDKNCPGCESPEGEQFPQPHRDPVTNCLGWFTPKFLQKSRSRPLARRCSIAAMCAADLFDPFDRPFFRQNPSGRANILVRKLRDRFHFQAVDYRQIVIWGGLEWSHPPPGSRTIVSSEAVPAVVMTRKS